MRIQGPTDMFLRPTGSRTRLATGWTRARRPGGQAIVEWVMIAGVLAAVGLFFGAIIPGALRIFVRSLALAVRTIAP
ncbi:MAG: hypothetical protein NT151_04295 [Acidobacteria bacterium]|nr:hypothetical protein [Acidobacteriota bacterium]